MSCDKIRKFGSNQRIILYPDADADADAAWKKTAIKTHKTGYDISVSNLIEKYCTEENRKNGNDLVDYLIRIEKKSEKEN